MSLSDAQLEARGRIAEPLDYLRGQGWSVEDRITCWLIGKPGGNFLYASEQEVVEEAIREGWMPAAPTVSEEG